MRKVHPNVSLWVAEPLQPDVVRSLRKLAEADDVRSVAVMPDVHLARDVCVGVALATSRTIYPAAVGGDIGCGMAAVRLNAEQTIIDERVAARVLRGWGDAVPILRHSKPQDLPPHLLDPPLASERLDAIRASEGRRQLGTLGRGNHFLELQADDDDLLWLTVHTGSRGIGQAIRDHHSQRLHPLAPLDVEGPGGVDYLNDHSWALAYAAENRRHILERAADCLQAILGATPDFSTQIECHHNFVEQRNDLLIHRKGALDASEGRAGIIPGSMGAASYHVVGRGCAEALWSSSHGAGRAMSRVEARRRITANDLDVQMNGVWFDRRRAHRLVDEAPGAYKDIGKVMRAQRKLTKIIRRLRTVITYKGA